MRRRMSRWSFKASSELDALSSGLEGDQKTGVEIVQRALSAPLRQIAENAGSNGDVVVDRVRNSGRGWPHCPGGCRTASPGGRSCAGSRDGFGSTAGGRGARFACAPG